MSRDEAVSTARDVPTIRVTRERDGVILVDVDAAEWHDPRESADLATWLTCVADTFADYDATARVLGLPVLSAQRMADEIVAVARCLLLDSERGLFRSGRRWRFRAGVAPDMSRDAAERSGG